MSEAFIYLWYDARNKMYYLGKHKGSPDDTYTHSSTMWESFTKDNIPEGVRRRILIYGTHEEMCVLEHELQTNRKKRCWDRYYNEVVCDGVYGGFGLGENNPQYKHGRLAGAKGDREIYNKAMREYYKLSPERREYQKEWAKTPKRKASQKAYQQTPKYKLWQKEYNKTPERKAVVKKYLAKKKSETQGEGTLKGFL